MEENPDEMLWRRGDYQAVTEEDRRYEGEQLRRRIGVLKRGYKPVLRSG